MWYLLAFVVSSCSLVLLTSCPFLVQKKVKESIFEVEEHVMVTVLHQSCGVLD